MAGGIGVDWSRLTSPTWPPSAILFEPGIRPVETRDSIRAFIASFPGVRVEVATATPDTIEVHGTTALYWGVLLRAAGIPWAAAE